MNSLKFNIKTIQYIVLSNIKRTKSHLSFYNYLKIKNKKNVLEFYTLTRF